MLNPSFENTRHKRFILSTHFKAFNSSALNSLSGVAGLSPAAQPASSGSQHPLLAQHPLPTQHPSTTTSITLLRAHWARALAPCVPKNLTVVPGDAGCLEQNAPQHF